jgi:hypothetical protein
MPSEVVQKMPSEVVYAVLSTLYRIVNPSTTFREFLSGVSQGSIISPLLVLIYIADGGAESLTSSHAEFADDLTLWFSSYDDDNTFAVLNSDLLLQRDSKRFFADVKVFR